MSCSDFTTRNEPHTATWPSEAKLCKFISISALKLNIWRANRRDNRWNPSQYGRQRGFNKFIPEGYDGFEQFMSGKSYRVNLD